MPNINIQTIFTFSYLVAVISLPILSFLPIGSAGETAFPNIGYLGRGYDIFKGNPDATLVNADPGFRSAIYSVDEYGSERIPDLRSMIPNGVECFAAEVCDVNFQSRTIENTKTYYDFLLEKVSLSGEGSFSDIDFSGSFSGSEDYKRIEETTWKSKEIFTISSAKCSKYTAKILAYTPPPLHANFYAGMMYSLPVTYDETKYMKFLSTFGTHVVEDRLTSSGSVPPAINEGPVFMLKLIKYLTKIVFL
ncbi:Hypothetical predicted protein [Paramuricea clavata]|uniref:Uncharacterized protein n=1 Tax=Paramuricea clavata TaxID=317549 RepID=A0A6S7KF38_PARCT|nr:Hypothetical predicted protein [Paramuricea clavata]